MILHDHISLGQLSGSVRCAVVTHGQKYNSPPSIGWCYRTTTGETKDWMERPSMGKEWKQIQEVCLQNDKEKCRRLSHSLGLFRY